MDKDRCNQKSKNHVKAFRVLHKVTGALRKRAAVIRIMGLAMLSFLLIQSCSRIPQGQPEDNKTQISTGPLNVRAFGAVGDGKADDTDALQRALTAAAAMGGNTVTVPAGTYVISAPISIGANSTLSGVGGGSIIKSGFPTQTHTPTAGHKGMYVMVTITGKTNVRIANLVFDANQADVHVIRMENGISTAPLIIENNQFVNLSRASADHPSARSLAISLSGGRTFTRNNYCDGASSDTYNYNGGWHLVENNIIIDGEDGGIAFNNGAHGVISGNWIFNCDLGIGMGHPGTVEQSKANSTTIIGNTIEQCMLGINMGWFMYEGLGAPRNWTISGNSFKNNARGDINYDGPHPNFAANGAITGNTSYGVGSSKHDNFRSNNRGWEHKASFARLNGCDNVTITGNTIVDPQADGSILSFGNDRNIIIANNLIRADDASISLTCISLTETSQVTVSGNRSSGIFDFFVDANSEAGLRSLHINDNVVEAYRQNAIRITGAVKDSEIIDNRFFAQTGTAKAIACPDMQSTVVVRNIGK